MKSVSASLKDDELKAFAQLAKMLVRALRETPGGMERLGKIALENPFAVAQLVALIQEKP